MQNIDVNLTYTELLGVLAFNSAHQIGQWWRKVIIWLTISRMFGKYDVSWLSNEFKQNIATTDLTVEATLKKINYIVL
jgi:hypothetical protein